MSDLIRPGPPGSGVDVVLDVLNWPRDARRIGIVLLESGDRWTNLESFQESRKLAKERDYPWFPIGGWSERSIPSPEEQAERRREAQS